MPRLSMRGALPPPPQYVLMVWCLFKAQFTFFFLPLKSPVILRCSNTYAFLCVVFQLLRPEVSE